MEKYRSVVLIFLIDVTFCQLANSIVLSGPRREMSAQIQQLENTVEELKLKLQSFTRSNTLAYPRKRSRNSLDFSKSNGITLRNTESNVAFYASLLRDTTLSYGQTIVFTTARTNVGGAYDKRNGVFTCPVTGTYVFSLVVACESGDYLETSIVKGEDDLIFNSICKNQATNDVHQNGGNAIVNLIKGDKISVKMVWPSGNKAVAVGRGFSTFSGFLLPS